MIVIIIMIPYHTSPKRQRFRVDRQFQTTKAKLTTATVRPDDPFLRVKSTVASQGEIKVGHSNPWLSASDRQENSQNPEGEGKGNSVRKIIPPDLSEGAEMPKRPRSSPGVLESTGFVALREREKLPLHPIFALRAQRARASAVSKIVEIAYEAGTLEREIATHSIKLSTIAKAAAGEKARSQSGESIRRLTEEENAEREKLAVLRESKANAAESLAKSPLEYTLVAMEVKDQKLIQKDKSNDLL